MNITSVNVRKIEKEDHVWKESHQYWLMTALQFMTLE